MTNKHQEDPWHKSPPDTTRVCMVRVAVHQIRRNKRSHQHWWLHNEVQSAQRDAGKEAGALRPQGQNTKAAERLTAFQKSLCGSS